MAKQDSPFLDFEAEIEAEDHFRASPGQQSRGTFEAVCTVQWDHVEADWDIGDIEPAAKPKRRPQVTAKDREGGTVDRKRPSQAYQLALKQLRDLASQKRWRGAVSALKKASRCPAQLSKHERLAIAHVLKFADGQPAYSNHSKIVEAALSKTKARAVASLESHRGIGTVAAAAAGIEETDGPTLGLPKPSKELPDRRDRGRSVERIRRYASERNWLSPKASRALAILDDVGAQLGRSEKNALTYLLDRCAETEDLKTDAEILRSRFSDKSAGRGDP